MPAVGLPASSPAKVVLVAAQQTVLQNEESPLPSPAGSETTADSEAIPLPIDISTALQAAAGQNPQVGFAQQRIQEAEAQLRQAKVMWVPSIRVGGNYNKHEGRIQDVRGRIIDTSRGSAYGGLGAQAVGAGSPFIPGVFVNVHASDAIFQPRIAAQALGARQHASATVRNALLRDTALAYTNLLEALQIQAVTEQTVVNAQLLSDLTGDFAETGQGLIADADRSLADLSLRKLEVQRAKEQVRVASVRLNRLLSQDQSFDLQPVEEQIAPLELVSPAADARALVSMGLSGRPELAESRNLVGEAVERLRRDRYAPLVPSVLLGMSYGGNLGGLGGAMKNFGDRMDFDAGAFWELRNLGFGEQNARSAGQARIRQAQFLQVQVMDQVASEVAEAQIQVQQRRIQLDLARSAVQAAQEAYRRDSERVREAKGLPIETLQSIQALDQAQRQYVRAVSDYNRAQFQLHHAVGWPVQSVPETKVD
jgi:outer membrane protein TolC